LHNSLEPVSAVASVAHPAQFCAELDVATPLQPGLRSTSTGQDLITAELERLRARHTRDLQRAQRLTRDQQQIRYLAPTPALSEVRAHLERVYAELQRDGAA
jgi:hypothetical protein